MILPEFNTFLPPALYTSIDGKLFVVPGWTEVTAGTTLKEVQDKWSRAVSDSPRELKPSKNIDEYVSSSKGDKKYHVKFDGTYWDCDCAAFSYRRRCRHIDEVKSKLVLV